jgi:hypothetical protein
MVTIAPAAAMAATAAIATAIAIKPLSPLLKAQFPQILKNPPYAVIAAATVVSEEGVAVAIAIAVATGTVIASRGLTVQRARLHTPLRTVATRLRKKTSTASPTLFLLKPTRPSMVLSPLRWRQEHLLPKVIAAGEAVADGVVAAGRGIAPS